MNHLYLIGGTERSGKTTILNKAIMEKPMIAIQTDAIRDGLKEALKGISEGELVWNTIVGLINYYDSQSVDLIIEGIEITPERVKSLNLKNLILKPVFFVFTENTSFDKAIDDLDKEGFKIIDADIGLYKKRFDEHIEKGKKIASDAEKYCYKFFSFDNNNFEKYCNDALIYLLK